MSWAEDDIQILVVDDDEGMVLTLRDVLDCMGFRVAVATSGREALEQTRERRPECILMDVKMPGMTGVEAYREIKRVSPESLVIFMTAYSKSSLVEEAEHEGAIAVLTKPLDLERVLSLIEGLVATPIDANAIVVLLAAFPELREDMVKGLAKKAAAGVEKPFEVKQLVDSMRQAIQSRRP